MIENSYYSNTTGLFNTYGPLFIHVSKHKGDVGCQKIVHFVAKGGLTEELGAADEVSDRHMEVSIARRPVRYSGERVGDQNVL